MIVGVLMTTTRRRRQKLKQPLVPLTQQPVSFLLLGMDVHNEGAVVQVVAASKEIVV